jgi:hypothetical protein
MRLVGLSRIQSLEKTFHAEERRKLLFESQNTIGFTVLFFTEPFLRASASPRLRVRLYPRYPKNEKPPVLNTEGLSLPHLNLYDASLRRSSGTFDLKFRDSVNCSPPFVTSVKSPVRRECNSRITSRFTIIER